MNRFDAAFKRFREGLNSLSDEQCEIDARFDDRFGEPDMQLCAPSSRIAPRTAIRREAGVSRSTCRVARIDVGLAL